MMNTNKSYFSTAWPLVTCLCLAYVFLVASSMAADEKVPLFQELKGLKIPPAKLGFNKVEKPFEIDKRKDLKAIFGKGEDMMALRKSVDFEKQKMLLFRWPGSSKDSLNARAEPNPKDEATPLVIFDYVPGLIRDLSFHAKAYVLPKAAKWEVVQNKPGVAKGAVNVAPKLELIIQANGQQIRINPGKAVVQVNPAVPPKPPAGAIIRGGIKGGVFNGRVPMPNRGRSMRVYHQWTGFIPEGETPSIDLPEKGYVLDEETWVELWHAWRPTEKVPSVDFQNEVVFVGSQVGKSRVYVRATKTEEGEVTMSVNGSGNVKGLSYSFGKFLRAGITSINGERLPGAPD